MGRPTPSSLRSRAGLLGQDKPVTRLLFRFIFWPTVERRMSDFKDNRKAIVFALMAAVLFGISTPLAKTLTPELSPVLLAGLLYLGSGLGLGLYSIFRRWNKRPRSQEAALSRKDFPWLVMVVFFGGLAGPVLLMWGLARTPASSAALLLNLEGVLTALWAIDNNFTRKLSASDPVQVAMIKGLSAGSVNTVLALILGTRFPGISALLGAGLVGFVGYGVSLVLFILALRHVGTARTGAYFSTAPFIGAAVSIVLLEDRITLGFLIAAGLMSAGVWLHLTERHEHEHRHEAMEHEHLHTHDEHHRHAHRPNDPPGEPHSHWHRHEPLVHTHPHYPDIHHRHTH